MNRNYLFKIYLTFISLCLWSVSSTKAQNYNMTTAAQCNYTAAGNEIVNFTNTTPNANGNGTLTVYFQGDFDGSTSGNEYLDFYGEGSGPALGSTTSVSSSQCGATYDSVVLSIPMADINTWAADGTISITADGASGVSTTCSGGMSFCVYMKLEYPRASGLNDIGIVRVDTPTVFCAGTQNIWVTVQNYGINQINSCTVNWTWNGVAQTPLNITQLIDTAQGINPNSLSVMLGTRTITDADTLVVWTSNPNGGVDTININDTITQVIAPSLIGTYTINSAVATGGSNYQSFTDFANDLATYSICGPIIANVAPGSGPYNEQVEFTSAIGSNAVNTITINGNGNTLTMSSPVATNDATLNIDGADYITINNLTIEALGSSGIGVHLMNGADNNTFRNCTINASPTGTGVTSGCVNMSASPTDYNLSGMNGSNNLFDSCSLSGGYFGFFFYSTGDSMNNITNCTVKDYYVYGSYNYGQSSATISNNIFDRATRATVSTAYGVLLTTGCENMLVEKNTIRNMFPGNNSGTGYLLYCAVDGSLGRENKFFNNLVYNIGGNGTLYGLYLSGADYVQAYHNTIVLDDATATSGTTRGIYSTGTVGGIDIRNNIIYIARGGTGTKHCLYFTGAGAKNSNYNDLYMGSTAGSNYIGYSSTNHATLTAWQSATGGGSPYDANSLDIDPMFLNAVAGDFTPTNAALDNMGTPILGVTDDLTGAPRDPNTPDMGAIEFSVSACSGMPVAGTIVASTTNVCLGGTSDLSLIGTTIGSGLTFQWEEAVSLSGPWIPNMGSFTNNITVTPVNIGANYYRCAVTCGSFTAYSDTMMVMVPAPFAGGTYTIDAGSPASSTNFQSFNAAIAAMDCGISGNIVFNVAPNSGPYNEQIELPATIGSDASNTVTFNGNGNVLTTSSPISGNYATVNIDGADYITFNNLTIEALGTDGFGVHLMNGADNNTFRNCIINVNPTATGSTSAGVSMSGSATSYSTGGTNGSNNLFDSCTVSGGYFGFVFYSVSGAAGDSMNNITNCTIKDYYIYGSYNYYQHSATISNNIFDRATRATVSTAYGVRVSTGCENMLVEKNTIRNMFPGSNSGTGYMLYCNVDGSLGRENKFFNNLVYNIGGNGTLYGLYLSGADYVQAYHNTIVLDDATATSGTTYGIYSTGTVGGIDIQNNLVYIARGGTGTKYCLYFSGAGAKNSNYNNLYMGSTSGSNNIGYSGSAQATLSAWQSATGAGSPYDANSLDLDPMFANIAGDNLTPTNSMLDNMGIPVPSVVDDINGIPRNPVAPDMGAIEFSVPPCTGTPVAGTATANVSSACIGGPVELSLTGFSIGAGITIQWEESLSGIGGPYMPIIGANSANYTALFGGTSYYRAAVSCNAGMPSYSDTIAVAADSFYKCYCSPLSGVALHGATTANSITNVSITSTPLNSTSSAVGTDGYTRTDYMVATNTATLVQAVNYTLNVDLGTSGYGAIAWVDYDRNGLYDQWEWIPMTTTGTTASGTIYVPLTSGTGLTGLRVRVATNGTTYTDLDACTNAANGRETEDYVIDLYPAQQCTGIPAAGTATADNDTLCVSGDVFLSLAGYSLDMGITLNWQSSPGGANNFTDIPGATMDTFTAVGVAANTDFRARVTCNNPGGGTSYSNTISVIVNNPTLLTTVPGSRCGPGNVALFAQADNGGTVNWYDQATGGNLLGTGNVFVTPSITTTTPFYAAPSSGGGGAPTQVPLPTHSSVYSGLTRGYYFVAPVSFTITGLMVAPDAGTGLQYIHLMKCHDPMNGSTTGSTNFTTLAYISGAPNNTIQPVNIKVNAGDTIGVMGTVTGINNSYSASGAHTTSIEGFTVNLNRFGYQGSIETGPAPNYWGVSVGTSGQLGRILIYYSTGCEGPRTQVDAIINPTGTGNLATGGTVVGANQADGTTEDYNSSCGDKVASVTDASGGNVLGVTTATTVVSPSVMTYNSLPYVPRVFDISPSSNGPATVTLYVLQSEFTAYNSWISANSSSLPLLPTSGSDPNISNIVITQWHGDALDSNIGPGGLYAGPATFIPNSSITASTNGTYWTLTFPVTGFSGFFIHTGASPLPIHLTSITANNFGNRNRIDWMTVEEKNAQQFELQRSSNAYEFAAIAQVNAAGRAHSYSYWDENPLKGMNYYRLKMYDKNGQYSYSEVVKALVSGDGAFLVEAYPNPVSEDLTVKVTGSQGANAEIQVTDVTGKTIKLIKMNGNVETISMSGLANGIYMIKYTDDNRTETLRVNKQ